MTNKLALHIRPLLLGCLAWFCFSTASSQQEYYIQGEFDVILGCNAGELDYFLVSDYELYQTTWEITGNAVITEQNDSYASVLFLEPGSFWLTARSYTLINQEFLVDSVLIIADGTTVSLEVGGCYEVSSKTGCYQVCAHSQSTIYFSHPGTQWEVTGAESYTLINGTTLEVTWGAGGNGLVTSFGVNCQAYVCFEIIPEPIAAFNTSPPSENDTLTVCKGQEIYFDNLSVNGLEYQWDFGDGDESNLYDVSHGYDAEGFYTVTLMVNTICNCDAEKQIVIEVLPAASPTLDCVNSICPETRQKYTSTTDGCDQFVWTVSSNGTIVNGGGITDDFIEVIWHEGPEGMIELSVTGCLSDYCTSVNTFRIPIITPDGPVSGDQQVCSSEVVNYSAPYFNGTEYQWEVGPAGSIIGDQNSNDITIRWSDVNTVTSSYVAVQYNNCFLECGGGDTLPVVITPEIVLTGEEQVCQNGVATIMAEAGFSVPIPVEVEWHIEDASGQTVFTSITPSSFFSHAFSYPPGEYTWVATNSSTDYCTEVVRKKIFVTDIPAAPLGILGEEEICPGQPYGFTIDESGNYSTIWTITDGGSTVMYEGQTIQHTFGPTPPYIVQAVHSDIQYPSCVSQSGVTLILKTNADLAIAGPLDVCFNDIDAYTIPYISGTDYTWEIIPADHGEIKKSELNNVEVFWTQTGPATLRLHACGSIIDKVVEVHALPIFNLTGPIVACADEFVSISTDQPLLSHAWYDDDNNLIGNLNTVSISPGSYNVSVTDGLGCASEKLFEIVSYPVPSVRLTSAYENEYCTNIPGGVEIVANTDGSDYVFRWFKDGIDLGPGGPVFSVTDFAEYYVIVTNQYGCTASSAKIIFHDCCIPANCPGGGGGPPGAGCTYIEDDFDVDITGDECQSRTYTPQIPGLTPGKTSWIITTTSEGTIAFINADILEYDYNLPGYYHIYMTAERNGFPYTPSLCGHFQKIVDTVRAVADFKITGICAKSLIEFEDLTTFLPGESIASWTWEFDDPASGGDNVSSLQHPTHIFLAPGDYDVKIIVAMQSGCTSSKVISVHISDGPALTPVYDDVYCENEALAFQLPGEVFDVKWNFGDPASLLQDVAQSDSVFHTYDVPANYTVLVSAANILNCRSDATFIVDIRTNTLSGLINVDPATLICFGDTTFLTAPAGGETWSWSTGEITEEISVTESNQYNVLIKDEFQCTYSPPAQFIGVSPKPEMIVKAREILGPDIYGPWEPSLQLCYGTEFEIQIFSQGIYSYQWAHGPTGKILSFTSEGGNLPTPGIYPFSVVAIDGMTSCVSDTAFILIEIFDLPAFPIIGITSGSGCSHQQNILQVMNPQTDIDYYWSDGQEGSSITAVNEGGYFVTAIDTNGCSNRSSNVQIKPSADIDQIPGGCFLKCDPLTVCLPSLSQVVQYNIYQNGVLFQSGTTWPVDFLITEDGSYTFEVTSTNGCVVISDPLDVTLYPGVGNITVLTYLDTDGDGMISAADVLLPNIPVEIFSGDGQHVGATFTDSDASFVFEDYPASPYTVSVNHGLLSSQWLVVIDSVATLITTCGDSVVVSLLLKENCTVSGPDQLFEICPGEIITIGDSIFSATGQYTMHFLNPQGCDSTFQVDITSTDSIEISTAVWSDVDHNGILSPPDTLVGNVPLLLENLLTSDEFTLTGGNSGIFEEGDFSITIDTAFLNGQFTALLVTQLIDDTICGSAQVDFLLTPSCQQVFIIQQEILCPGDSIFFYGSWIDDAGVYSFLITDPGAFCDTTLDLYVTLYPDLFSASTVTWNCETLGTIELDPIGHGPFAFEWGQGISADPIITELIDGTYLVTITDANGCDVSDTINVISPPVLQFDIEPGYEIHAGDSVEINITGDISIPGLTFDWSADSILSCGSCSSTFAFPLISTLLTILITDNDSCVYGLETYITVIIDSTEEINIYVPNVFSPNDDGINDRFNLVSNYEEVYLKELIIYDRWGELLYKASEILLNAHEGWDGTFRGKNMNPGVFAFQALLRTPDGKDHIKKGNVTLLR